MKIIVYGFLQKKKKTLCLIFLLEPRIRNDQFESFIYISEYQSLAARKKYMQIS